MMAKTKLIGCFSKDDLDNDVEVSILQRTETLELTLAQKSEMEDVHIVDLYFQFISTRTLLNEMKSKLDLITKNENGSKKRQKLSSPSTTDLSQEDVVKIVHDVYHKLQKKLMDGCKDDNTVASNIIEGVMNLLQKMHDDILSSVQNKTSK